MHACYLEGKPNITRHISWNIESIPFTATKSIVAVPEIRAISLIETWDKKERVNLDNGFDFYLHPGNDQISHK